MVACAELGSPFVQFHCSLKVGVAQKEKVAIHNTKNHMPKISTNGLETAYLWIKKKSHKVEYRTVHTKSK